MEVDISSLKHFKYCIDNREPYFGVGLMARQGTLIRYAYMDKLVAQECLNRNGKSYNILEIGSYAGMSTVTWAKAIQKYNKFAEIAEADHMPNVAYLFKALVNGEMIHLANHKRALGEKFFPELQNFEPGNTLENLKTAVAAETWEYKEMYPSLIKSIKKENSEKGKIAKLSMTWAKDVEITHAEVLRLVISYGETENDFDLDGKKLWVCQACGNLFIGDDPNKICPVCKHSAEFYKEVAK